MGPPLKSVKVPLDGIPSFCCNNCTTQLGVFQGALSRILPRIQHDGYAESGQERAMLPTKPALRVCSEGQQSGTVERRSFLYRCLPFPSFWYCFSGILKVLLESKNYNELFLVSRTVFFPLLQIDSKGSFMML